MAAPLLDLFHLVTNTEFKERLQAALWITCVGFLATGTAAQKTYARQNLRKAADTDDMQRVAIRCAAQLMTTTPTDAQIQTVVDAVAVEIAG